MEKNKKILDSIGKILNKNKLLTLSTSRGDQPYSSTAYYVFDNNFNLYIWSEGGTTHERNISKNNKVAVNIFNSSQKWGSLLQGIQATGIATKISNKELVRVGTLYVKRFPASLKIVKNVKGFHNKVFSSRLYKIKLDKIKVFDEKSFGKGGFKKILLN